MSANMVLNDNIKTDNEVEVVNSELSFKEQQALSYAFLDAFYDRQTLGYDVKDYTPDDVTQDIIEMGRQIVTNTRIVAIAEVFYNIGTAVGLGQTFLRALKNQFEDIDNVLEIISLISVSKDKLIQQKNIIMSNFFARAVLIQILNARKQEIELKFLGF